MPKCPICGVHYIIGLKEHIAEDHGAKGIVENRSATTELQELAILFANGKISEEEYLSRVQTVEKEMGINDKKKEGLRKLAKLQKEGKISEQTYQASVKALEPKSITIQKHASAIWYLAPLFFGLIGGLIGYMIVKERDPDMANNIAALGLVITIFAVLILWAGYAWLMSIIFRY